MILNANKPLVSVIVPSLNRAQFLASTVESILQQHYPNLECIVVDGGSTDGTLGILKSYGDKIRWISESDKGHADAINKGWRMSRGEILAWLNVDDLWRVPDAATQAVDYFLAHPDVDVVYGDCEEIDSEGKVVGKTYSHEWDLSYAVETCDHCIPQPAAFIRRNALERVNWLDASLHQKKDHDLWLRIGLNGQIKHVPRLWAYERNVKGLSSELSVSAACSEVTRKFFSLAGVPGTLSRKKRRALSNACIRGAQYAWANKRDFLMVCAYGIRALWIDPLNLTGVLRQSVRFLRLLLSSR